MGRKGTGGRLKNQQRSFLNCELENANQVRDLDLDQSWVDSVRQQLIAWYEEAQRDFPWRHENDPYRILVSEMMLVQTTVAAVIPYFERFLRRFPDVQTLASAQEADVLRAWEGLGYYRRARQLQAAARTIVDRHGGEMPRELAAVRALPGVGRYVAGAILSFAFDLPAPIVEANSQRVLARLLAWRGDLKTSASQTRLWAAAERLVPPRGAGKFNQALMDLGALICTPRSPACLLCPLASLCAARRRGIQDSVPVVTPRPRPLAVTEACALVVPRGDRAGRAAERRRPLVEILGVSHDQPRGSRSRRTVLRCFCESFGRRGAVDRDSRPGRARDQDADLRGDPAPSRAAGTPRAGLFRQFAAGTWPGRRAVGRHLGAGRASLGLGGPETGGLDPPAFSRTVRTLKLDPARVLACMRSQA